jgi:hypothetical protein
VSAADAVHPVQLSMFMPARDLYNMTSLDTAGFGGDVGRMRASKRKVNAMSKLNDVSGGINKPVQLLHGKHSEVERLKGPDKPDVVLANGNHRVTAAYDENPDMEVPVVHHDQFGDLIKGMQEQDRPGGW